MRTMPTIECAGCGHTNKRGESFFRCDACGSWYCSCCGHKGGRCSCGRGTLR